MILLISSCLLLAGLSLTQSTDDLLRLEIEEAATDSRLLAEELADMLARLEADESRQEAVEAVVAGDDIKVETALQDMLTKLETLEQVATEESKSVELKGTLDDKIKKEAELRETLETLESVTKEIKDASSAKEADTVQEVTQLLNSINDEIESKAGSLKKVGEFQSALHLNGIDEMIRSLEKVTGELQDMQDDINDYFNEDSDTGENAPASEEGTPAQALEEEKINNSTSKTLSEILTNRNSSKSSEEVDTDGETEQRSREPKQLEDEAEYYDEFSQADVEEAVEEKSDVETNESQKAAGEDCSEVEAKKRVSVCLPKFRSVEQEVKLYSSKLEEVRHCYDVTKTVCSQSSQIVSKEVCVYGYSQNIVVAPVQLAEITFEKNIKKFSVSKCKKAVLEDGYKQKDIEACEEEYVEIPYRLPSIVDNLDDFYELNLPEPDLKCQLYKYEVPEVMCEDITRRECSDLHHLHQDTVSLHLETATPDYQGHCRTTTLSINQTECIVPQKYSTFY